MMSSVQYWYSVVVSDSIASVQYWYSTVFSDSIASNYFIIIGPGHAKMCNTPCANNKGADQPVHARSLISTFVVHCLDSMICTLAIFQSFKILASFFS